MKNVFVTTVLVVADLGSLPMVGGFSVPKTCVSSHQSPQSFLSMSNTNTMASNIQNATTMSDLFEEKSSPSIPKAVPMMNVLRSMAWGNDENTETRSSFLGGSAEYQRGLLTIIFITLLFASNSPVLRAAFSSGSVTAPPVLLLNAAVSFVALVGLVLGGESLESSTPLPSSLTVFSKQEQERTTLRAGTELGLWKFLGTTANLYGLALTTAGHGALLIQLTTLIVPIVQGIQGVPIPKRIQASVVLALAGVVCFTQDPMGTPSATGDLLCVLAAIFYSTYDLRLFAWGKKVAPRDLITTKIGTQAILSGLLLLGLGTEESIRYITQATPETWSTILPVVFWSGVAVNAVAPFLQVGGQQAVGPTRCQTVYASQPLYAAIMGYFWLGETIGLQGMIGGSAFVVALFLAATAEAPIEDCGSENCEV